MSVAGVIWAIGESDELDVKTRSSQPKAIIESLAESEGIPETENKLLGVQ